MFGLLLSGASFFWALKLARSKTKEREDNGVFVDRSLDTFISKLRKKFKDDASINIINIHGVGYKLEVIGIN